MKSPVGNAAAKVITPLALAIIAVLWMHGQAWAPTVEYDVTGMWHGIFLSDVTGETGPFIVNNTSQRHRRFAGVLDVDDLMIPYEGTLAASNEFTVVGKGADGMFVVNQGDLMVNGDGTAFAEADFRLTPTGAPTDSGTLCFLQDFKATNPPQLFGEWTGLVMANGIALGMVDVMLPTPGSPGTSEASTAPPSFFFGRVTFTAFPGIPTPNFDGPFGVTISDADAATGMSLVHALAKNSMVMVMVNGTFTPGTTTPGTAPDAPAASGPHIDATFTATFADGSVLQGSFMLAPPSGD